MSHNEILELLESYAFGILEIDETRLVEEHLSTGCQECHDHLRLLSELNVRLADGIAQREPSARVKEQLFARIRQASERRTETSSSGRQWVSWTMVVLATAAVVVLALQTVKMRDEIDRLSRVLAETEDVTDILNSPGMQFVDLHGVEPNTQSFGKVVVDPQEGNAVVYMYRLPAAPEGMEYQLWVMRDGKPTSAGVFTVSEDGHGKLMLKDMVDGDQLPTFLVTIEPEGGEIAPTGMMYLTGP